MPKRKTGFVFDELYMWHDSGGSAFPTQPSAGFENPETKRRFYNLLAATRLLDDLQSIRPRPASEEDLARFHTHEYITLIRELSAQRGGDAVELTPCGGVTLEIARLYVGGVMTAVEE